MIIRPQFLPPCGCTECVVANVTTRERPFEDCHGRELARWWVKYEQFLRDLPTAIKAMPPAVVPRDPDE